LEAFKPLSSALFRCVLFTIAASMQRVRWGTQHTAPQSHTNQLANSLEQISCRTVQLATNPKELKCFCWVHNNNSLDRILNHLNPVHLFLFSWSFALRISWLSCQEFPTGSSFQVTYQHYFRISNFSRTYCMVRFLTVLDVISLGHVYHFIIKTKKKKTPWPLVRERTIPTERPPLVDEI
jgi:hypothetical protein